MSVQHGTKTDLQRVKKLAKALLFMEPETTEYSPVVIHHPFASSGIVALKGADGGLKIGNILESQEDIHQWRKLVGEIIDESKEVCEIIRHITKPYLLGFVKYAAPMLSGEDYAKVLADAWIRSENPNNDPNLSREKLLSMFKAADPAVLMDADERARLDELGKTVTVYRGVRSSRPGCVKALSWTLDQNVAQWFADRYGRQGTVYEAKIDKKHIHALFLGRNESEVIVDPKYLTDITQVQTMEQGGMKMEGSM